MGNKDVVKELNAFLKGQYMGIHAYENLIQHVEDPNIKKLFQNIQKDHKEHAMQVAERIQNLDGKPVDDEGIIGSMQGAISQLNTPRDTQELIKHALVGEGYYGIQISEEIVKGDLDEQSSMIIEEILDKDRNHVKELTQYINKI